MDEKVSIIIPVYNEEERIKETIKGILDAKMKVLGEIIIIDDGSTDQTKEKVLEMKSSNIIYNRLAQNSGKGAALRRGVEIAKYPIIAFLDGDVGMTSKEIAKLIEPVYLNKTDVTIAAFPSPTIKGGFGIVKKVSSKGIRFLTGKNINNPICGQRAFRKDILKDIEIPDKFSVEVGMTIDFLNRNLRISEIPVLMKHRETKRDMNGFIHRGKELVDILYILIKKYNKYKSTINRW